MTVRATTSSSGTTGEDNVDALEGGSIVLRPFNFPRGAFNRLTFLDSPVPLVSPAAAVPSLSVNTNRSHTSYPAYRSMPLIDPLILSKKKTNGRMHVEPVWRGRDTQTEHGGGRQSGVDRSTRGCEARFGSVVVDAVVHEPVKCFAVFRSNREGHTTEDDFTADLSLHSVCRFSCRPRY
ncbi:hypothetical protein AAG570_010034 [Ranatra chinensis]|uniref:Uncharacterized protein n=1 Tax=Ranatra chinensis TaxID=642074 RepID=A0ABD0YLC2_9HEMI